MAIPSFKCPVCRNALTLDVVFAHEGVRDAILKLIQASPEGERLLRPLLGYVGLFAPAKTEMRFERVASLLGELVPMIRGGTIADSNGTVWPAPLDYWRQAMEETLARRDRGALQLPLKSHGYLTAIVVGMSNKTAAKAEQRTEAQRAGHAGAGTAPSRMQATTLNQPAPRAAVPESVLRAAGIHKAKQAGESA